MALNQAGVLAETEQLEWDGDLAERMVDGLHRFLDRETQAAAEQRGSRWSRDYSSPKAYARSVDPNRERLRGILGATDQRVPFDDLELIATHSQPAEVAAGAGYRVLAVRWPVLPGVDAEGLLLEPVGEIHAQIVALPDCDCTPEQLVGLVPGVDPEAQFARRLAESGCRVLIPLLIDRSDTYSGNPDIRMTNQPHREFLYRGAFEMGRHIIGYEVQKVLAAVDWFAAALPGVSIGVAGYGEGGMLAFYSAALDARIQAALVSGYFGPREGLWQEPLYRNVWALLREFGDAEIASLICPRALVVEHSRFPEISGPPAAEPANVDGRPGRRGAAPGAIATPASNEVLAEVTRAGELVAPLISQPEHSYALFTCVGDGVASEGSEPALQMLLGHLGRPGGLAPLGAAPVERRMAWDPAPRLQRQFEQLLGHTERLLRDAADRRRELWSRANGRCSAAWVESTRQYREHLWTDVIGKFPAPSGPTNPRTRLVYDEPEYLGYEVVLDMWDDVFAYGILLVPKGIAEGERRPVVVCQHGLEGRPQHVADAALDDPCYHAYAARLVERGFITFSPQNPYLFGDRFRLLQRKLNPLGKSLFSIITAQHERILDWLETLPCVDAGRIGFYGLSYGGKTAMRVPALLERYCLSICSGDFNEWIWKNVSTRWKGSYMFTGEWEMFEWNLGHTYNYAEMSWLICPRPFMVERGHDDGCAPDEWIGYEFAKTRERYDRLGLPDQCEIEYFNGPHTIHGVGTFAFLHRHLHFSTRT